MNKNTLWAVLAIAVIVVLDLWWYTGNRNTNVTTETQTQSNEPAATTTTETPASTSTSATVSNPSVVTVNVEGGEFYFKPSTITVKKGDTVKINFSNVGGIHDWVIDAFNARTPRIGSGQSATVQFVADKAGSFEYYCSVGQHRAMGMKGTLTVTP